ncbi:MAG: hypothetical protein IME93_05565 [Proteobacteria bacterium]|nr:hypothetical protein [Pseudomonadota bacterium]
MASKINTDKINASLEKADIQWQLYRHSISNNDGSTYAMFVALSSDKVLALMNTTTGMYEKVMATNKVAGNNK